MNDNDDDGVKRLFRAMEGLDAASSTDHTPYLDRLPALVEAEMAGEAVAVQFADLLSHLDGCFECSEEYAALLDLALAEARGELPQPASYPPLRLPTQLAIQQLVGRVAEALSQTPRQVKNLPVVLQTFFELARESVSPLTLDQSPALVMGLSNSSPELLGQIMAAYYALSNVFERYPAGQLEQMPRADLQALLQKAASEQVKYYNLSGAAANAFTEVLTREVLTKYRGVA
jgi:hypothetical protein